ncbi:MAG TPA: NifB/NifX family molybdenum-iron cluster-binding protein [Bacteroidales bacterium]|nr:NifB/NifX family molybdenum-iron cluster-binding protein [Bacteroidales bacterium]HPS63927.1 NifB/NifX family molybdenum-iron cluster-binding protein [Bacteroidales bacterium]
MKIAIPSDDGIHLSQHFGRTRGFVVVDTENGSITGQEYRTNTFTGHALGMHSDHPHGQEGHGHHSHQGILEALGDCAVVIAGGMGYRLLEDLTQAGKKIFNTTQPEVIKAVQLFLAGNLISDKESCDHH